jgi:hypothetical protein
LSFVLISVSLGVLFSCIPLVVAFELYHWMTRKTLISRPVLAGGLAGPCLGGVIAAWSYWGILVHGEGGEGGLAAIAMLPLLFVGFLFAGLAVGSVYKRVGRCLLAGWIARKRRQGPGAQSSTRCRGATDGDSRSTGSDDQADPTRQTRRRNSFDTQT